MKAHWKHPPTGAALVKTGLAGLIACGGSKDGVSGSG